MKNVITPGHIDDEVEVLTFKCHRCECEFESDEYETKYDPFVVMDATCTTRRRTVSAYIDTCPECGFMTCVTPEEKKYVFESLC